MLQRYDVEPSEDGDVYVKDDGGFYCLSSDVAELEDALAAKDAEIANLKARNENRYFIAAFRNALPALLAVAEAAAEMRRHENNGMDVLALAAREDLDAALAALDGVKL